jgi:hypothetical protein
MRKIRVDESIFIHAFERDVDFHDHCAQSTYLDLETGEVLWIYEEDDEAEFETGIEPEENAALREQVDTSPERYLLIPGRDHGEHHDILREFLKSPWTDDEELRLRTRDAYAGSIGRWMEAVDDQAVINAYCGFRDRKIKELAEEFFEEHGLQPVWR